MLVAEQDTNASKTDDPFRWSLHLERRTARGPTGGPAAEH